MCIRVVRVVRSNCRVPVTCGHTSFPLLREDSPESFKSIHVERNGSRKPSRRGSVGAVPSHRPPRHDGPPPKSLWTIPAYSRTSISSESKWRKNVTFEKSISSLKSFLYNLCWICETFVNNNSVSSRTTDACNAGVQLCLLCSDSTAHSTLLRRVSYSLKYYSSRLRDRVPVFNLYIYMCV